MTAKSATLSHPLLEGHWASEADGEGHVVFAAEGIHCANCARSIRSTLDALPGIKRADVNVVNSRVSVSWDTSQLKLGTILGKVAQLGFKPVPLVGEAAALAQRDERRAALKRIGLAALGSMQVMMYAGGLYAGAFTGIDASMAEILRYTCWLITTPVLFYSGAPILRGGLHDLRRRVLGMDVTVSLALVLAYLASAYNTLRGSGEVYFDSVAMFILFLLVGRYYEMRGRHQAANVTDALTKALPTTVQRIDRDSGQAERIELSAVHIGDWLRVGSGQVIPVDGKVATGVALVDESLVTGEAEPARRHSGDVLLGGSLNAGAALTLEVTRSAGESTLHGLVRLLERAQSERPRLGLAAERMASWFVVRVLILTTLVGIVWTFVDPDRAFPAVLAVLVATCPCALSLATPVAIAAATSRMARLGVLVMRSDAVEGLAKIDTLMLDKTGTLTQGKAQIRRINVHGDLTREHALAVAAALESASQHPLAAAFREHGGEKLVCDDTHEHAGLGIEGTVAGTRWRIGRAEFALRGRSSESHAGDSDAGDSDAGDIVLADEAGNHARFHIADALREDAVATMANLRALDLEIELASGDRPQTVAQVAAELGIEKAAGALRPEEKLANLRALQQAGHRVLMVGDGINDGPVLAAADVSMAMGRGSSIAHAAGDLLLLRESLSSLPQAVEVARRSLVIVRQNLRWSAAYNMSAIPLAAVGLMPPWVAAIGMSLSSLLVVFNARRILR